VRYTYHDKSQNEADDSAASVCLYTKAPNNLVGIESKAKLILAWHLGRRSAHDARFFAENRA